MATSTTNRRFTWQLQDAKNRLSEVVKRAVNIGPQTITLRGKPAAVVVSYEQFKKAKKPKTSLTQFLAASPLHGVDLDLQREDDEGRDIII